MTEHQPEPDDVVVIMCMRQDQMEHVPVAGAEPHPCGECGEKVWVAPSSRAFMKKCPQTQILCNECGMLKATRYKMEHPDEEFITDAVPGASKEFVNRVRGYLNAENN